MKQRYTKYGVGCVCGVYLLTNKVNGKQYVGSSNNVAARVSQHFTSACRKKQNTNDFYRDIAFFGLDGFSCELLEECVPENKIERERHWYFLLKPEYNLTIPTEEPFCDPLVKQAAAKGRSGEDYVRKQQNARVAKMRPCYGVSEIGETPHFCCIREAARWVGEQRGGKPVPNHHIARALNKQSVAYGYHWYEGGGSNG